MGPLLPISEVLIPLKLSGGTQDNHENQKPLILGLCSVCCTVIYFERKRLIQFCSNLLNILYMTPTTY